MKLLGNFITRTIREFFQDGEVRRQVCSISKSCSGGGALTEVTTTNSSNITFTGNGTSGSPLSATITGDVVETASNGLYVDGTEVKLGSNYTVDDAGTITTQVAVGSGSLSGGTFNGIIIDPNSNATQVVNGDFYLEIGSDHFILTNQASGSTIESLASTDFLRINGGGNSEFDMGAISFTATTPGAGIEYFSDYSANYTNRSLVDKEYVDTRYIGGQSMFTADGTTDTFDIVHNLGVIPPFFSLTTTTPITLNHLNRTITFPDNNTLRVTFASAPLVGEDVNYVWIVYK
jgi:hypothetical protein